MSTPATNQIEAAEWEIIGDFRLSDAAISALAELALDLVEAEEADGDGDGNTNQHRGNSR
ncbi:MAG: hypothetical protein IID44_08965 [Planctomycetes bacterium]|nr:hypothetical protein [Planctomycetota bacterium]